MEDEFGSKIREYKRIISQATENANSAAEKLKDAQGNGLSKGIELIVLVYISSFPF